MQEPCDIRFSAVRKTFGAQTVIPSLDLEVRSGERLVLLGPSGCGKSTIMRLIAGLEQPVSGTIAMGGQIVNGLDASERNVSMVFQNYALYPHMTVFDNMAFSLKLRKVAKAEITRRIQEAAEKLELGSLLQRKPRELSGGQRQRVALGRAIVQQSSYFLLDEPLSNLDAQLRTNARNDLVELHKSYPRTMVYVTHDQVEAMTIGQRIAVLRQGELQQIGSPEDIYMRPANRFVAAFMGNPPMNIVPVTVGDQQVMFADGGELALPESVLSSLKRCGEQHVLLGIRPEALELWEGDRTVVKPFPPSIAIRGEFIRSEYLGAVVIHHIAVGQHRLLVSSAAPVQFKPHSNVTLTASCEHLHFFEAAGAEQRIPLTVQHLKPKNQPEQVLVMSGR
ncbi:ABC transporter ATP-binding protein [Brevibacillus massiliensis]|uniref:ABC transporter ATP-binding protein n=1 Tax=Brevibacillus massiliensis TaxID=1118054 RepID=UPI0002FA7BD6|nr:ABC transporter ATP-binding protein [Brevibacillus massiliensis]